MSTPVLRPITEFDRILDLNEAGLATLSPQDVILLGHRDGANGRAYIATLDDLATILTSLTDLVGGSGTAGAVAVWTDTDTIGSSILKQAQTGTARMVIDTPEGGRLESAVITAPASTALLLTSPDQSVTLRAAGAFTASLSTIGDFAPGLDGAQDMGTAAKRWERGYFSSTVTASGFAGSGAALTALNASALATGTVGTARLGSGTANNTTFLRGDGTWQTVGGGGADRIVLSGNVTGSADVDGSGDLLVTTTIAAGQIVNSMVSGSAAIAYTKLSLAGSIVNADVAVGAAIVYSKLSLAASIVNADIAAAAAIALSKLAGWPADASGVLTNNGSGTLTWGAGGGISGLTTGTLPKAASSSTLADSIIKEASSIISLDASGACIVIGQSTASGGRIRLPNNGSVQYRNQANTANILGFKVGTDDTLYVGTDSDGSGNVAVRVNGRLSWYADATHDIGTSASANRPNVAYIASAAVIGNNPASTGAVRLSNNVIIGFRNAANSGNINAIQVSSGDSLLLTGGGAVAIVNATGNLTFSSTKWGASVDATFDLGTQALRWQSLYSSGGQTMGVVAKTTTYTATANDSTILCSTSGGSWTLTLPAAASHTGRVYRIKKTSSDGNTLTVDGNASETIDGATTKALTAQYETLLIQCDGSNWHIVPVASASALSNLTLGTNPATTGDLRFGKAVTGYFRDHSNTGNCLWLKFDTNSANDIHIGDSAGSSGAVWIDVGGDGVTVDGAFSNTFSPKAEGMNLGYPSVAWGIIAQVGTDGAAGGLVAMTNAPVSTTVQYIPHFFNGVLGWIPFIPPS